MVALLLAVAGPPRVAADHCFGVSVEPSSGPAGTVFVIRQGGADSGIVTLFHDGSRVASHRVDGWRDAVRFRSTPGDVGRWRAHLVIPVGDKPCGPNDWFTVTGTPDTATIGSAGDPSSSAADASAALLGLAGLAGALLMVRRLASTHL
jgi:hypothetical protein